MELRSLNLHCSRVKLYILFLSLRDRLTVVQSLVNCTNKLCGYCMLCCCCCCCFVLCFQLALFLFKSFSPGGSVVKNPPTSAGDSGSIPGSGRTPAEGNSNPLQYSCLGNPMDRGAWWATVHGVEKRCTQLSNFHFTSSHPSEFFRLYH